MICIILLFALSFSEEIKCPEGQGVDPLTNVCVTCSKGEGILENGFCGICPNFQGINSKTKKCQTCPANQCIFNDGICTNMDEIDAKLDETTKRCVCDNFYGFNEDGKCQQCYSDQCVNPNTNKCEHHNAGADPVSGKCIKCKPNEAVNMYTRTCGNCPEGSLTYYSDNQPTTCQCPNYYGYDPVNNKCVICNDKEGIRDNYTCGPCPKRQGISYYNRCDYCYNGGVDENTKKCREFEEGEGIDPITGYIITCPEGSTRGDSFYNQYSCICNDGKGLNSNKECIECGDDEVVDEKTGYCTKCADNQYAQDGSCYTCYSYQVANKTTKECMRCEDAEGYCRQNDICIPFSEGFTKDGWYGFCKCQDSTKTIDIETNQCIECPHGSRVDDGYCYPCTNPWYCLDNETEMCRSREYKEGVNSANGYCQTCDVGEGLDPVTYNCGPCKSDECINPDNGECIKLGINVLVDPETKKCTCPSKQGFDDHNFDNCILCTENKKGINENGECINVYDSDKKCIDPETRKIRSHEENEGFDPVTFECYKCPENTVYKEDMGQCSCNETGYGIDFSANQCVLCKIGEVVDEYYQNCTNCSKGYGIDEDNKCNGCYENHKGIDKVTRKCGPCKPGEGINYDTHECIQCGVNQIIDNETGQCTCLLGYVMNEDYNDCTECPDGTEPSNYNHKCNDCNYYYYCFNNETRKCNYIDDGSSIGKDPINSKYCFACPPNSKVSNYMCTCDGNKGFNSDFTECIECGEREGINSNGQCGKCPDGYCIDESTLKCVSVSGNYVNATTGYCISSCSLGYDKKTRFCGVCAKNAIMVDGYCQCPEGEGVIDPDYVCGKCPIKHVIDNNNHCSQCQENSCINENGECSYLYSYGINMTDGTCLDSCPEGFALDQITKYCREGKENECIMHNGYWRTCGEGESSDEKTKKCKCPYFQGYNSTSMKCEPCKTGYCIDSTGECYDGNYINATTGLCIDSCTYGLDPLTKLCGQCAKGSIMDTHYYYPHCKCEDHLGVIEGKFECGECQELEGIDSYTHRCKTCEPGYGIDVSTRYCVQCDNDNGYGIDPKTRVCVKCKENEGINSKTKECRPCLANEGISPANGQCIPCLYPKVLDKETNKCLCPEGQGYNSQNQCEVCSVGIDKDTMRCKNCTASLEGIEHDSRICVKCPDGQGIDMKTKECVDCPEGSSVRYDSPYCACPTGQGFDVESQKCVTCGNWKGIDNYTNQCTVCQGGYGIDPATFRCRSPYKVNECIDKETGKIITAPPKYGKNEYTKICEQCPDGLGFNVFTGICEECPSGQHVDEESKFCVCDGTQGFMYEQCRDCDSSMGLDPVNHKCVYCANGQGINETTKICEPCAADEIVQNHHCTKCPEGTHILNSHSNNNECGACQDLQTPDSITNKCTCPNGMCWDYFNTICRAPESKECINQEDNTCKQLGNYNKNEGIDPETSICTVCDHMNPNTRVCIVCPEGSEKNPTTNLCECKDNKGIDPITNKCITCPERQGIIQETMMCDYCQSGQGIDPATNKCMKCKDGEGIDSSTGKCGVCETDTIDYITGKCKTSCSETQIKDPVTKKCICPNNQAFSSSITQNCIYCSETEGIDPKNYQCTSCQHYECIDTETGFCRNMTENEGRDFETFKCQVCQDGTSLDPKSLICKCIYGFGYDPVENKCKKCSEGKGINPNTNRCEKCAPYQGIVYPSGECGNCQSGQCIDRTTFECKNPSNGQTRSSYNGLCTCEVGYGFNEELDSCVLCGELEGVDEITNVCRRCNDNECIYKENRTCIIIPDTQIKDNVTDQCTCPFKQGLDSYYENGYYSYVCRECQSGYGISPTTLKCTPCSNDNHEGIDHDTGYCRRCTLNEGINTTNKECQACPEGATLDYQTHTCKCAEDEGIDIEQYKCTKCNNELNYAIDWFTGICVLCTGDKEIDPITKKCICSDKKGFHPYTHECFDCSKYDSRYVSGIDSNTRTCKSCLDGYSYFEGIDPDTGFCTRCNSLQGLDKVTKECTECPGDSTPNYNNHYCECPIGKIWNENNTECIECPKGYGIDRYSKQCVKCSLGEGIDNITKYCNKINDDSLCIDHETGIYINIPSNLFKDSITGYCQCANGYGFDQNGNCVTCENDQGTDFIEGYCRICPEGQIKDKVTNKCICQNHKGFDDEYKQCVDCAQNEGMDKDDFHCRGKWYGIGECIDRFTGIWTNIPYQSTIDSSTNLCKCNVGYGLDPETHHCVKCQTGYGVDPETNMCTKCPSGAGVVNYVCVNCSDINGYVNETEGTCNCYGKEGFDYKFKCINCSTLAPNAGLDKETGRCTQCSIYNHEAIDPITGYCRECNENEGIDPFTFECKVCPEGATVDNESFYCKCPENQGIDKNEYKCTTCNAELNYGIDIFTGYCRLCNENETLDSTTKQCACRGKLGYDDYTRQCINCSLEGMGIELGTKKCIYCQLNNKEGIDKETGYCRPCESNEGIDYDSHECMECPQGSSVVNNMCKCEDLLSGLDETKTKCVKCEIGYGISYSGVCKQCQNYEGIDPETRECIYCGSFTKCTNPITKECIDMQPDQYKDENNICRCYLGYGIDKETGNCTKCSAGQGIDYIGGYCRTCSEDQKIDNETGKCVCQNFKGFDSEYKQCIECKAPKGVDPTNLSCIDDVYNSCIDRYSGFWTYMNYGMYKDSTTHLCLCHNGYGLNETTGQCDECESGYGTNHSNYLCYKCPDEYAIEFGVCVDCNSYDGVLNQTSRKCVCEDKKGFSPNTNMCINCTEYNLDYGIDPNSGRCTQCNYYNKEAIDPITRVCRKCKENEGIDQFTYECKVCPEGATPDNESYQCKCPNNQGIDPDEYKCTTCNAELNYGIDVFTGYCRLCNGANETLDPTTKQCICIGKLGYNEYTRQCINCSENYTDFGIDKETRICRFCEDYYHEGLNPDTGECTECLKEEGINPDNKQCITCPEGSSVYNHRCKCNKLGFGLDESYTRCDQCGDKEGIDQYDWRCSKCPYYQGIDPDTRICKSCWDEGKCTHPVSLECADIPEGFEKNIEGYYCICIGGLGFDVNDQTCKVCPSNQAVDWITGVCMECPSYQVYKEDIKRCICPGKQGFSYSHTFCQDCSVGEGVDPETYTCVYKSQDYCIDSVTGYWKLRDNYIRNNITGMCECPKGSILDPSTGNCNYCKPGELYDPINQECVECPQGYGLDWFSNECRRCVDNEILDESTNRCICKDLQGFDSVTHKCKDCPTGYGVDPQSLICIECSGDSCINKANGRCYPLAEGQIASPNTNFCSCKEGEGINSATNKCGPCVSGQGIDESTGVCIECNKGEGIKPTTNYCGKCASGEGIDFYTNRCTKCSEGQSIDSDTKKCICGSKQGFDHITHECISCPNKQGIDPASKECALCSGAKCIDEQSGECRPYQEGQIKDSNSYKCKCRLGFVLNPSNNMCETCGVGEGIDQETNKCVKCKEGEGVNPQTYECVTCPYAQGINATTGFCDTCISGEGINHQTRKCGKCSAGKGIDNDSRECISCKSGYGADPSDNVCRECNVSNCVICTKNRNYCSFCSNTYSANENGVCIPDKIPVATPTPTPKPVDLVQKIDDNVITFTKSEEAENNNNTNYVAKVSESSKTVVVEDLGQDQMEVVLDEKVNDITIQPQTDKPLKIVVNSNNNDEGNVVIKIDTSNVSSSSTSLKGEGQLMLQNNDETKDIELDQIVPNKDGKLTINSTSKVAVKQIDLFGNSIVEFTNQQEKAVVNSVTLQTKAQAELDNVIIDGDLKAGVLSMIRITESVNISKTNLELSYSDGTQTSNPVIVGDLTDPPNAIVIKDNNLNALEETTSFAVAEGDEKFKCREWSERFDKNANPKYNNADCVGTTDGMTRLLANYKKKVEPSSDSSAESSPENGNDNSSSGGLSGGAIAGIVVGVIVCVAVVVFLVVYFVVIRKKHANSQNEDDSFSDRENDAMEEVPEI